MVVVVCVLVVGWGGVGVLRRKSATRGLFGWCVVTYVQGGMRDIYSRVVPTYKDGVYGWPGGGWGVILLHMENYRMLKYIGYPMPSE